MTREQAKALLPIITAWANGETIQIRYSDDWLDVISGAAFDGPTDRYRIKPKPREYWMNIYPDAGGVLYPTKAAADANALSDRVECIKLREVTE